MRVQLQQVKRVDEWQQGGTSSAEALRRAAAGMLGSAAAKAGAAPPRFRATSRAT